MTILVTGATGHVGRPLVEALLKQGEKVRVLVRDKTLASAGVEIVTGDLLDKNAVNRAIEGIDTIYHLAAVVDYKATPKKLMYAVNVNGTKNILEFPGAKKVIYLSSAALTPCMPACVRRLSAVALGLFKAAAWMRLAISYAFPERSLTPNCPIRPRNPVSGWLVLRLAIAVEIRRMNPSATDA